MTPMPPAARRLRLTLRIIILLALAGLFAWQLRPLKPTIARPEGGLIVQGSVVTQDFVWKPPHPILCLAQVRYRDDTGVLVLTTEDPRRPQPLRSHLYLISPDVPGRVKELSPEPDYNFWDMSVGDVDGDGQQEVGLCTYSQTARDPNVERRFFVYGWDKQGDLTPLWRGSQLCRPYLAAALADMAGDDAAELVSIEKSLSGKPMVVAYKWNQFGFWGLGHTGEYDAIGAVTPVRTAGGKALRIEARRLWRIREVLWRP